MRWRGMTLGPVPAASTTTRPENNPGGVLVVGVDTDSPLRKQGICAGSVIKSIAGRPVVNLFDLQSIINDIPPEKCDVQLLPTPTAVAASVQP